MSRPGPAAIVAQLNRSGLCQWQWVGGGDHVSTGRLFVTPDERTLAWVFGDFLPDEIGRAHV